MLTLAGGLASTIFAPITAGLAGQLGWRDTYLVLAAVLAVVTVPGHLLGLRPALAAAADPRRRRPTRPGRVVRSRAFLALVGALALAVVRLYAVVVNLVPLLAERGFGTRDRRGRAGARRRRAGTGPARLRPLARRLSVRARTVVVLAAVAVTTGLLAVADLAAGPGGRGGAGRDGPGDPHPAAGHRGDRPVGTSALRALSGVLAAPLTFTDRGRAVHRGGARRAARRLLHHADRHGHRRPRSSRPQPRLPPPPTTRARFL